MFRSGESALQAYWEGAAPFASNFQGLIVIAVARRHGMAKVAGRHRVGPPIYASEVLIHTCGSSKPEYPEGYRTGAPI